MGRYKAFISLPFKFISADSDSLSKSVSSVLGANICSVILGSLPNHYLRIIFSAMNLDPKRHFICLSN